MFLLQNDLLCMIRGHKRRRTCVGTYSPLRSHSPHLALLPVVLPFLRPLQQALHVFLLQNDLLCIIRGHEQKDGFEFGKAGPKYFFPAIISAFSAPNYTDR